jgi:hypothetical protein
MLPGFRFLFAAIILSMSILIFGLGAAALLRAAHEEFASNPSWHATPETTFAQQGEAIRPEATRPVLAMLRVDPPVIEKSPDAVPAAPAAQAVIPQPPAEPKKTALKLEDSSRSESATPEIPAQEALASEAQQKPDIPVSPSPAQDGAAPVPADASASGSEKKIAATEQALSPATGVAVAAEAAPAVAEPAGVAAAPDADAAATRIATLGGPPVTVEEKPPAAKATAAKPHRSASKKQLRARQAAQRRRIAARTRLARQAPAQPVDLFGQPVTPARSP